MGMACECIDGVVYGVERSELIEGTVYMLPRPSMRHSEIVFNIARTIGNQLHKGGKCRVYSDDVDFHYHVGSDEKQNHNCVSPDVIIVCNRDMWRSNGYYGPAQFVVEVSSPSTVKRDRTIKMDIYAAAGVGEYWIVTPDNMLEVYYLVDGRYQLERSIITCDDKESDEYNMEEEITLREYPEVTVTVEEIFE